MIEFGLWNRLGADQAHSSSESLGGILPTFESSSSSSPYVFLTNFFGLEISVSQTLAGRPNGDGSERTSRVVSATPSRRARC